ncbi:DUF2946 domain-containing protein [Methylobacterium sp. BTF04]|uniref:DUF2946 family protein n=1 Tax=Methylobacterium sp. BTF04 TaxID=2708300 RepID=UPI0013D36B18|nr:DUF2946 family protein [Methylobacterium sp. BTF04]NEU13680.1 DUF2946 domain-containing protein [Methylobacterium sp. BTF04]
MFQKSASATSSHRLLGFALVALSLWLQALVPAATVRMLADPLRGAVICGHGAETAASDAPAPALGHGACPLCMGALTAPKIPSPPQAFYAPHPTIIAWSIPPPGRGRTEPCHSGQPRGPPIPS